MTFSFDDIPNLNGKVAIVTGSNTGIGFVTARKLAKKGCHVIFASRSREKTLAAIESIKPLVSDASKLEFILLDLMSLQSVYNFVDEFRSRKLPLHILINNAGIMTPLFELSADGIESQFATNHVGHHALTVALLPILEESAPSRVVVVSSEGHKFAPKQNGIDLENLNNEAKYSTWAAYGRSKLGNIFFARELSRQLRERGVTNVYINTLHHWSREFAFTVDDGAKTQLYLATSEDIVMNDWHGKYFMPIAQLAESSAQSQDEVEANSCGLSRRH
ncbi:hypothetical protein AC1031_018139 [Aphanomyces cochlioides]|nr:hypothetical protein AC1031_018139 [Aphanomyces cochlioides]